MSLIVTIRDGIAPDETTGLGGANEGHINGLMSDILLSGGGVADLAAPDAKVTQVDPSGTMQVQIADGVVYVPNASYSRDEATTSKYWRVVINNEANKTIVDNSSGSTRYDLIAVKVDTTVEPNEFASNVATLEVVQGTGGAGIPATPSNHYVLAVIEVINGATAIPTSKITDMRSQISIKQNVLQTLLIQGGMLNGKIVTSVASNDLTVAIKTLAGNDPSTTEPVYVRIGNTIRAITAALSLTLTDGTNYFNAGASILATKEIDYFVYLGWDATNSAVRLAFSRLSSGRLYSDFNATNTNERYLAKSGTLNSTDELENVGRFNAILSASASFNWSLPATSIVISKPIYHTRWLDYTPAISATSGTITSSTVVAAKYKVIDDVIKLRHQITVTTNGTGAGGFIVSLPFTPTFVFGNGRENGVSGKQLHALQSSASFDIRNYDNTYPAANGASILLLADGQL